tara:strand:+ start:272 stop:592 length:321 start_codon:yes stop_codon:yes gene_type:complete
MKSTFRSTIDDIKKQVRESGGSLTKLDTPFHAESLNDWLKDKLPKHLESWVIDAPGRENEVNVYTVSKVDGKGDVVSSIVRSPERSGMPERVRQWKKRHFKLREKI